MSKSTKSVHDMLDYVRQLRRHTEGRRAVHVRLSCLEKHFREEHYRRFVATALRPLITGYGATMFALPNADVVLMVKGATVDTIDPLLNNIRRKYKDAALLQSIDPIQGVSDAFVEWFDLEEMYPDFLSYIQDLADNLLASDEQAEVGAKEQPERKRSPGMLEIKARSPEPIEPNPTMRMVTIERQDSATEKRYVDPDIMRSIVNALSGADVGGMVRKQRVMAILGTAAPQPVMVHRFIPFDVLFDTLLETSVELSDRWLSGYLEGFIALRLLASVPGMQNEHSIASSVRVSCDSVCSKMFDQFDQSLGKMKRSSVIIEFSVMDLMANYSAYQEAHQKLDRLGYKVAVADIDPRLLPWMDYANLQADFIKLKVPTIFDTDWMTPTMESVVKERIHKIGLARIILDGCGDKADVDLGRRLGITLFQGVAVDPYTTN